MGCGITTVKYLMFFFNLIFALCGLGLLIAGALTYVSIDKADHFMDKVNEEVNFSAPPIVLMVIGSIIFVIAFFGCCGAIQESHCMIVTFAVFLLVLLIAQIAIGIVAFVQKDGDGWTGAVKESITESFREYPAEAVRQQVDDLQRNLECCGVDGPTYWYPRPVPPSCCVIPGQPCPEISNEHQVFQRGCVAKLEELLRDIGILLGAIAIAVVVVEIIGIVFALCLASSIRNSERRGMA